MVEDKGLASPEQVESLELVLGQLDARLEDVQSQAAFHEAEYEKAVGRVNEILAAMRSVRATLGLLTGEGAPPPDEGGTDTRGNARHAVLAILAHTGEPMTVGRIVEVNDRGYGHAESAIRSALVRAVSDEDARKVDRGVYQITDHAKPKYDLIQGLDEACGILAKGPPKTLAERLTENS